MMEIKRVGNVRIMMDSCCQNKEEFSFRGLVEESLLGPESNSLLIGNNKALKQAKIFKENPLIIMIGKIDDTYSCISGISMKKVSAKAIVDVFLSDEKLVFVDVGLGIMPLLGINRYSPDILFHNRPCTGFKIIGSTGFIFKTSFLEAIRNNTNREDGKVSSTVVSSLVDMDTSERWKVIQHDNRDILIKRADYAKIISDIVGVEFGGTGIYTNMRICYPGTISCRWINNPLTSIKMRDEVKGNVDKVLISFVDYMERMLAPVYR